MSTEKKIGFLLALLALLMLLCTWYHTKRLAVALPQSAPAHKSMGGEAAAARPAPRIVPEVTVEPQPARKEPILFSVVKKGKQVRVGGVYYDEAQMEAFAAAFGPVDSLERTAPRFDRNREADEALAVARDLAPLFAHRFRSGSIRYDGKTLTVSGELPDRQSQALVRKVLAAHPNVTFSDKTRVVAPIPTTFDLIKQRDNSLTVHGNLSRSLEREMLDKLLKDLPVPAQGSLKVDPRREPASWIPAVKELIPLFVSSFDEGKISYHGGVLSVEGKVEGDAVRKQVEKILKHSGEKFLMQLEIVKKPEPKAEDAGAKKQEARAMRQEKKVVQQHIKNLLQLENIEFETGSARLTPKGKEVVDRIAAILDLYDNVTVEIAGYTDNVGDPKSNLKLSERRVESVKKELVSQGIDPARLKTVGYGEANPLVPNDSEKNRKLNRRVEFHILNIKQEGE